MPGVMAARPGLRLSARLPAPIPDSRAASGAPAVARPLRSAGGFGLSMASPRGPSVAVAAKQKGWADKTVDLADPNLPGAEKPDAKVDDWWFTETGQSDWIEALELDKDKEDEDFARFLSSLSVGDYDPDKLALALKDKKSELYKRGVKVSTTLGGFVSNILLDYTTGRIEQNQTMRAMELRDLLSDLGPAFAKIGQALSSRPDLTPPAYLKVLTSLQDKLPAFPSSIARALLEDELGAPVAEIFSELSEEPVAAASLGQVYKGRLRATGEEVAVKVQRPGIGEGIALDMLLLRRMMAFLDDNVTARIGISQPLAPLVDEFSRRLFGELDYVMEGKNCEKFVALYGSVPRVRAPGIYWEHTTRRVLVMEWIDGVKLTDEKAMAANGLDVVDFVDVGIECTLRQLLEHGYFHADPHPGNLLATRGKDLVYLDFGMMSEAPEDARYAIIAHVVHLVNRDYDAMCRDYYDLGFMTRDVDTSPIAPALAEFFDDVLEDSVSKLNFRAIVDGLGNVLFQFPFQVPAYYALILRSLTVLEGLAISADPEYKLLARSYPYMAKRLLTDPQPELRSSLEELLLQDGSFRWGRLENLLREGSKSQDFDSAQLWLLLEWVLTDSGKSIRTPLGDETVKLIDAACLAAARRNIEAASGTALADRLAPMSSAEKERVKRAEWVVDVMQERLPAPQPGPFGLPSPTGGLPTPQQMQELVEGLRQQVETTMPQAQKALAQPGAAELVTTVTNGLMTRMMARIFQAVLSPEPKRTEQLPG